MDTMDYETLGMIVAALPVAIISLSAIVKFIIFIRNLFSDKKEYTATVIAKERREEYRNNRISKNISYPIRLDVYILTFYTSKHKKIKFRVDTPDFNNVKEGDTGILTLQGSKFISFEKKCTILSDSERANYE